MGDCTEGICTALGVCETEPADPETPCNGGQGVCDGSGTCVECINAGQCPSDGNECTVAVCATNACGQADVSDGTACGGGSGECQSGTCVPVGPPTYDLTTSIFKPYNSLLPDITGSGDPATDCAVPDLSGNPGANLTGITTKCLIITDPDIAGSMTFEETTPGNFNVTGVQDLSFVIDVTIEAFGANVNINTNSSTEFTGTGTGTFPGTITLTDGGDGFNVDAAATGQVVCTATNLVTGDDVSCVLCGLANLQCEADGGNPVPLPGDPGRRTFPPIEVGEGDFQLQGGASATTGWYLSNPAPLAGNGTQWVSLSGNRQ
jgi:hypothetical protein